MKLSKNVLALAVAATLSAGAIAGDYHVRWYVGAKNGTANNGGGSGGSGGGSVTNPIAIYPNGMGIPNGLVGSNYSVGLASAVSISNDSSPDYGAIRFRPNGSLPLGLNMDAYGNISGTPIAASGGSITLSFWADYKGESYPISWNMTVYPPAVPTTTPWSVAANWGCTLFSEYRPVATRPDLATSQIQFLTKDIGGPLGGSGYTPEDACNGAYAPENFVAAGSFYYDKVSAVYTQTMDPATLSNNSAAFGEKIVGSCVLRVRLNQNDPTDISTITTNIATYYTGMCVLNGYSCTDSTWTLEGNTCKKCPDNTWTYSGGTCYQYN